jgi:hypothetical protein
MKKFAFVSLALIGSAFAGGPALAAPDVYMKSIDTPFGTFACKQRAQNRLFAMGATGVSNLSSGNTIWGYLADNTVGVWCRGNEAIVIVAGNADGKNIRDEVVSAF